MNHSCAILIPALLLLSSAAETLRAEQFGLFTYQLSGDGDTVEITDYPEDAVGVVLIPAEIDGKLVTRLGERAFSGCRGLTSVTIPEGVAAIGRWVRSGFGSSGPSGVFLGCSSLTSITLPESVTTIGQNAFSGCSALTSVAIPEAVTEIGESAFSGCSALTSVTIPSSVTTIFSGAFSGCSALTSVAIPEAVTTISWRSFSGCTALTRVNIPEAVTTIGESAFSGCTALTRVTIPEAVTTIGESAFSGCSGLTRITIPESVTTIGEGVFSGCSGLTSIHVKPGNKSYVSVDGVLFDATKSQLLRYPCSGLTSVPIPEGVTEIGSYAFSGCSGLTSVTIPEAVTRIGDSAFSGCSGLTSVTIPEGVTRIGASVFTGCSGLTSMAIPEGVTYIGPRAFSGCSALTNVTIPEAVNTIDRSAFSGCSALTDVTIPEGVTKIGDYAFSGCGLTSITIPEGIYTIGSYAFSGCGLNSITIPESVTRMYSETFSGLSALASIHVRPGNQAYTSVDGVLFNAELTVLIRCPEGKIGDFSIPEGVKIISGGSCDDCGHGSCSGEGGAFENCTGLTSITIPDSVTEIRHAAFRGCTGLTKAVFLGDAPWFGGEVYANVSPDFSIYYLMGSTGFTSPTWNSYPSQAQGYALTLEISSIQQTDQSIAIEWHSRPGRSYAVDFSNDLKEWTELEDSIKSEGGLTTYLADTPHAPPGAATFFRIREE